MALKPLNTKVESERTKGRRETDRDLGSDGLPDWMQFSITLLMFVSFGGIILLLFSNERFQLDEKFRDLLNIIVGTFLASFGKVVDFWFKHSKESTKGKTK
tara:strand:- start:152 stop:454 length:303 start_codon:yes stop_codon:yes gene_type:complete